MARRSTSFGRGTTAGILIALGALGAHWFITPAAYRASSFDRVVTAVQILVGFGGALWLAIWDRHITHGSAA